MFSIKFEYIRFSVEHICFFVVGKNIVRSDVFSNLALNY